MNATCCIIGLFSALARRLRHSSPGSAPTDFRASRQWPPPRRPRRRGSRAKQSSMPNTRRSPPRRKLSLRRFFLLTDYDIGRLAAEIEEATRESQLYGKLFHWKAYPKQDAFFATGKRFRERALMAGSQLGKTESASFEMACHLTGIYP